MNERIKELMKQADYPAPELALRAQKLAELIIRECASVCENSNYEFGTIFTKMIKEHFGVEE